MKKKLLLLGAILILLGLVIALGCTSQGTPPESVQVMDNSKIVAVKSNLNTDPELAGANIRVEVVNDIATLFGTVASEDAKKRAEDLAMKTHGITQVVNKLAVKE